MSEEEDPVIGTGVLGIKIGTSDKNKILGVGYANVNECIFHLIQLVDNDSFSNLERVLVLLSPEEVILSSSSSLTDDSASVRKILERHEIAFTDKKTSDFDTGSINQDLGRLLRMKNQEQQNISANPEMEKTVAVSALAGVLKHLDLVTSDNYLHQFRLTPFDVGLYVKMDAGACAALHITSKGPEAAKSATLAGIIDHCRTPQGHRLLAQYIRQPLVSKDALEERLDLVELFMNELSLRENLHEEHLRRIPDLQVLARKFQREKATLHDCYKAYVCIVKLPKLLTELKNYCGEKSGVLSAFFIQPLQKLVPEFDKFKGLIEETLDLRLAEQGEFIVRPDLDESLRALHDDLELLKERMENEARRIAEASDLEDKKSGVKLDPRDGGFVLKVTLKDEKAVRNNKELSIVNSVTSGVRFTTSQLTSLSERYHAKMDLYRDEQKKFIKLFMEVACQYYNDLDRLGSILAKLDVFISFAVASNSSSTFVRPILHPKGTGVLSFTQLRHPAVEASGVNFIPNDVIFDKTGVSFYIVTGPNMGGKSTFLRSVGVATLLAHIGCFVPADKAEVSITDAILARVGASDCMMKGVSTFMAEMIEASYILQTATSDSLVLIDELGRGTSTYEGFGLCWAISEHLAKNVKCFTVLATHFNELTDLEDEVASVKNVHVSALVDESGLTMLYKIEPGSCDKSFGLHVAQLTGFPDDVLVCAKKMAARLENFTGTSGDDNDEDEASVKQRRVERKDCEIEIEEFITTVEKLGDTAVDEEDFQLKLAEEYNKIKESLGPRMPKMFE